MYLGLNVICRLPSSVNSSSVKFVSVAALFKKLNTSWAVDVGVGLTEIKLELELIGVGVDISELLLLLIMLEMLDGCVVELDELPLVEEVLDDVLLSPHDYTAKRDIKQKSDKKFFFIMISSVYKLMKI